MRGKRLATRQANNMAKTQTHGHQGVNFCVLFRAPQNHFSFLPSDPTSRASLALPCLGSYVLTKTSMAFLVLAINSTQSASTKAKEHHAYNITNDHTYPIMALHADCTSWKQQKIAVMMMQDDCSQIFLLLPLFRPKISLFGGEQL